MRHISMRLQNLAAFFVIIMVFSALTFLRNGIWKNDIFLWDDAVAKSPQRGKALTNLGSAWMNVGRNDIAGYYFEKAKVTKPYWNTAFLYLGDIYFEKEAYAEAEKEYRGALQKNKNDTGALLRMSMLSVAKGNLDVALGDVEHILKMDAAFPDAHMVRGIILSKLKKPEEAIKSLEKARTLAPDHPRVLLNLGIVMFESGKYTDAEACLSEVDPHGPLWPDANLWLGRIYYGAGRYEKSVGSFEIYLSAKPKDKVVRLEIARAYENAALYSKAAAEYKKLLTEHPNEKILQDAVKRLEKKL